MGDKAKATNPGFPFARGMRVDSLRVYRRDVEDDKRQVARDTLVCRALETLLIMLSSEFICSIAMALSLEWSLRRENLPGQNFQVMGSWRKG